MESALLGDVDVQLGQLIAQGAVLAHPLELHRVDGAVAVAVEHLEHFLQDLAQKRKQDGSP